MGERSGKWKTQEIPLISPLSLPSLPHFTGSDLTLLVTLISYCKDCNPCIQSYANRSSADSWYTKIKKSNKSSIDGVTIKVFFYYLLACLVSYRFHKYRLHRLQFRHPLSSRVFRFILRMFLLKTLICWWACSMILFDIQLWRSLYSETWI